MSTPEQRRSTLPPDPAAETRFRTPRSSQTALARRITRFRPGSGSRSPCSRSYSAWGWQHSRLTAAAEQRKTRRVADIQQLMKELTTLNASLATTNEILANGIQTSSEVSAKANAELEQLSANLAELQAGIGQARATMGPQLTSAVRTQLGKAHASWRAAQRRSLRIRASSRSRRSARFREASERPRARSTRRSRAEPRTRRRWRARSRSSARTSTGRRRHRTGSGPR